MMTGAMRVLSIAEAAEALGCSHRTVRRRVERGELLRVPTGRRLESGHPEYGVLITGGAGAVVSRTTAASEREQGLARPANLPAHVPLTPDNLPDLVAMREMGLDRQADETERRLRAVSAVRALIAAEPDMPRRRAWARIAAEYGVVPWTLRRWGRDLERHGPAGLVPAWGSARGECRSMPPELQRQVLDAFAWQGRMTVAQVWEHVVLPYCSQREIAAPHYGTVAAFVRKNVTPLIRTVSRDGRRAYQEQHEPRVRRDLETAGVNGWWVSDHRLGDTLVMVDDGRGAGWPGRARHEECTCGSGKLRKKCCSLRRLWWTVTVDVCSAALVGWRFSLQPNRATVAHHLREAMLTWGVPQHWMRDNGKEFKAGLLGGPTLNFAGPSRAAAYLPADVEDSTVWQQLGVKVVTAIPYSSWSKYVESVFGGFGQRYENLLPGYVGNRPEKRPEKLEEEIAEGRLLTADQYVAAIERMIAEWNAFHVVGRRTQPPAAYYKEYRARRVAAATLGFMLQDTAQMKVRQGALEIEGRTYLSDQLALLSGQRVRVRYDKGMPGHVFVYPREGNCLAVPYCPTAGYGEWGEANLRAKSAARAQRQHVREWAARIKGCCPIEGLDPYGAHRAVQARLESLPADRAAAAQQQALAEAAEPDNGDDGLEMYRKHRKKWASA